MCGRAANCPAIDSEEVRLPLVQYLLSGTWYVRYVANRMLTHGMEISIFHEILSSCAYSRTAAVDDSCMGTTRQDYGLLSCTKPNPESSGDAIPTHPFSSYRSSVASHGVKHRCAHSTAAFIRWNLDGAFRPQTSKQRLDSMDPTGLNRKGYLVVAVKQRGLSAGQGHRASCVYALLAGVPGRIRQRSHRTAARYTRAA